MGRFRQKEASRGSQKWIQKLVNGKEELLNSQIRRILKLPESETIAWCSPRDDDEYAEYRDEAFLVKLGVDTTKVRLAEFWPKGGPQWDALAKSNFGKLFLIEAKSHIPELISNMQARSKESRGKISMRLKEVKEALGSKTDFDWSKTFYQYTNRLAHLQFLRDNHFKAYLVFVYFLNDSEMNGPSTADEWKGAIRLLYRCLGLRESLLKRFAINVFIDVSVIGGNVEK